MNPCRESSNSIKFPIGGLLKIKGIIKESDLHNPKQLDANGEECLIVVKNGMTTGVTIGCVTGIESFIRTYDYGMKKTSMEVAVYSYDQTAFSAAGDSGSIVVDGRGSIVGLLTGSAGTTEAADVTYLTPYYWIEEQIKKAFPDSFLYPLVD